MVMEAIAVSAIKHSCESILESFVSKYENHFDVRRNLAEDSSNEEFEIAVNGPNLANSDGVIKEAMETYWKGGNWHFFRTTLVEKMGPPTVMKRLISTKNNLPFMD